MVERFNGRIDDALKIHRFNSREGMEETLLRYVTLYNHRCRNQRWAARHLCRP